ncbi:MAG: tetratricopeptide repeat protein [bacterium]
MGSSISNPKIIENLNANVIEVENEKIMEISNNIEHHKDCKCKICRKISKNDVFFKIYLPLKIRDYFPIFVINPLLFFWFFPKLIDAINEKFINAAYDINNNEKNMEILNEYQIFSFVNFSNDFKKIMDLLFKNDFINAINYFDKLENINDFEFYYLRSILAFLLNNLDKAKEDIFLIIDLLDPSNFEKDSIQFKELVKNFSSDLDIIYKIVLFDGLIISFYFNDYEGFIKCLDRIFANYDSIFFPIFSFVLLILSLSLVFNSKENYFILDFLPRILGIIDVVIENNKNYLHYVLQLLIAIKNYRLNIFEVIKNDIYLLYDKILSYIVQDFEVDISNYKEFNEYNVFKVCDLVYSKNVLYKVILWSFGDKNYENFIKSLGFIPLSKVIINFLDYVKYRNALFNGNDLKFEDNISKINRLIENEPSNGFYWFLAGLYYFFIKRFDLAYNYFRGSIATTPGFTELRLYFYASSVLISDYDRALKIIENSIFFDPNLILHDLSLLNYKILNKVIYNFDIDFDFNYIKIKELI